MKSVPFASDASRTESGGREDLEAIAFGDERRRDGLKERHRAVPQELLILERGAIGADPPLLRQAARRLDRGAHVPADF